MARFKHVTTGAVVSVHDDKSLGSEWEAVTSSSTPARTKKAAAEPVGGQRSEVFVPSGSGRITPAKKK